MRLPSQSQTVAAYVTRVCIKTYATVNLTALPRSNEALNLFARCDHSLFLKELFHGEIGPDSLHLAVRRRVASLHGDICVSKHHLSIVLS